MPITIEEGVACEAAQLIEGVNEVLSGKNQNDLQQVINGESKIGSGLEYLSEISLRFGCVREGNSLYGIALRYLAGDTVALNDLAREAEEIKSDPYRLADKSKINGSSYDFERHKIIL